jgi:hypothetical protein
VYYGHKKNNLSSTKKNIKMKQVTDILVGAVSIALGVAVGTWAYNKFIA